MAQDISRSALAGVDATTRVLDQDRLAIAGTQVLKSARLVAAKAEVHAAFIRSICVGLKCCGGGFKDSGTKR
jgi:hypothetical protein